MGTEVVIEYRDLEALEAERSNLESGSAFASGVFSLEEGEECTAVLVHPETKERLSVPAMAILKRDDGVGLVFCGLTDVMKSRLREFAEPRLLDLLPDTASQASHGRITVRGPARETRPPEKNERDQSSAAPRSKAACLPGAQAPAESGPKGAGARTRAGTRPPRAGGRARETRAPGDANARVRNLSVADQLQLARRGDQMERTALERAYGKIVWEPLLANPKITQPEVARIARKGALPRGLLERIVDTPGWLTSPQIRRALLANRKLSREMITKVLRATPKSELKLVPKQRAYPPAVRDSAKKLISG